MLLLLLLATFFVICSIVVLISHLELYLTSKGLKSVLSFC